MSIFTRQTLILDPKKAEEAHVTICGLGTVGSHAAIELARMGVGSLTLIDGDKVEGHNLPSQAYHMNDVGSYKAEALEERVKEISETVVDIDVRMLDGTEEFKPGPVILAVDDMEARKTILEGSVADIVDHQLVIDGRMGGRAWQLISFDPCEKMEQWADGYYFPQEQAAEIPCGGRTVSFIGSFIGGMIAALVCKQINGDEIPFFMAGDLDSMVMQKI